MSLTKIDQQDLIVYGALGLSFAALLLFKSGDLIQGINEQSLTSANAAKLAKDNRIAEMRVNQGCSTGFVMATGETNLVDAGVPLDIRSKTAIADGACLQDETGATAIVKGGLVSDIRVSARIRKQYQERGFRVQNQQVLGGK